MRTPIVSLAMLSGFSLAVLPAIAQQGPSSVEYGPGVIAPAQINLQQTQFQVPQNIPDPVQAAPCNAVPTLGFYGQTGNTQFNGGNQWAGGVSFTIPLRRC